MRTVLVATARLSVLPILGIFVGAILGFVSAIAYEVERFKLMRSLGMTQQHPDGVEVVSPDSAGGGNGGVER